MFVAKRRGSPTPRHWLPIWNWDVIAGSGASALFGHSVVRIFLLTRLHLVIHLEGFHFVSNPYRASSPIVTTDFPLIPNRTDHSWK